MLAVKVNGTVQTYPEGTTYLEIAEKTGASTATISRVSRCLIYGADGYRRVLDRIRKNAENTIEE